MSVYKPAPSHNEHLGPAVCLCVECCRKVLTKRCTKRDPQGRQCGDYKHNGNEHTLLVCTVFMIAEDRVRAALVRDGKERE